MSTQTHLTRHLDEIEESYFQHMAHALSFAWRLFAASFACLVHGLLPFCFEKTGSRCIDQLHEQMVLNRKGLSARNSRLAE